MMITAYGKVPASKTMKQNVVPPSLRIHKEGNRAKYRISFPVIYPNNVTKVVHVETEGPIIPDTLYSKIIACPFKKSDASHYWIDIGSSVGEKPTEVNTNTNVSNSSTVSNVSNVPNHNEEPSEVIIETPRKQAIPVVEPAKVPNTGPELQPSKRQKSQELPTCTHEEKELLKAFNAYINSIYNTKTTKSDCNQ
jgi:hypothetical protein